MRELVTTGFLEALLAESDSGALISEDQDNGREKNSPYCRAWNRFTGVEMDIGDEDDNGSGLDSSRFSSIVTLLPKTYREPMLFTGNPK